MNPSLAHPLYIAGKAAVGALLALSVVRGLGLPDKLSATFVAVVCISPTVYSGLRRGLDQVGASAVGGAVVWGLSLMLPVPAAMGVALFVTVFLVFKAGFARGLLVACFTVLYVLFIPGDSHSRVLLARLASVAVGVGSALSVNMLVSLVRWQAVFARRLSVSRATVAQHFELLASSLAAPPEQRSTQERQALFETAFPVLRALQEELSDALSESRLRSDKTHQRLASALAASHQLLAVAHYGKDLALRLEHAGGPFPAAAAGCRALGACLRSGQSLSPLEPKPEEPVREPLVAAAAAWDRCRRAEERFRPAA